jgi:hypothetical protein
LKKAASMRYMSLLFWMTASTLSGISKKVQSCPVKFSKRSPRSINSSRAQRRMRHCLPILGCGKLPSLHQHQIVTGLTPR